MNISFNKMRTDVNPGSWLRSFIRILPFLGIGIFFSFATKGPVNVPAGEQKSYTIRWIGMFPDEENNKEKQFKDKVSGLVFGKKESGLMKPLGFYVRDKNDYWVLDQGRGALVHVVNGKSRVPAIWRKGNISYPSLAGICGFEKGQILFTDSRLNQILVLSTDQKKITVLNDSLELMQPTGIAWMAQKKEIWVVETKGHRISVLDAGGRLLRRIGKRGNGPGDFNYPTFIWIDDKGNVYIVDSMNFRLQILDQNGRFISSFGKIGDASGYFARPKGVAVDTHGNIYIADALYNVVQIYNREGNLLYYFGSQGHGKGQFWMPAGIFIDKNNIIYVADTYNSRVQIFQLAGKK